MAMVELLQKQAKRQPDAPALFEGGELLMSYAQWAGAAAGVARRLRDGGLQPGDRVVLFMRNHPMYLVLMWGVWWAGGVVVPVNAKLHVKEAQWIVDNAGATWAFVSHDVCDSALAPEIHQWELADAQAHGWFNGVAEGEEVAVSERQLGDLAWLFYTSGTTGRPKGVMITHQNLLTMGLTYFVDVDAVASGDHIVYAAPMSHGAGIYAIPHLMAGARHVVPASGGVDASEMFELGWKLGPLSAFAAPTIINRLVDHALQQGLSQAECARAFKTLVYGGAPMYAADIQRALNVMGDRFVQIYGQGETPMVGTALSRHALADRQHPSYERYLGSIGWPQSAVQVRIARTDGTWAAPDEVGEVVVKGPSVMAGYWRNPEATQMAIRDGWLWTGDMGCADQSGFITLKDRSKDMIISGGSNIYPREIEEVLLTLQGVHEVAVVGEPHPEWGESVVAFVVADPTITADALNQKCLDELARFKRPKRYVWVDTLPKNNYGKVLKTELRARCQHSGPGHSAPVMR